MTPAPSPTIQSEKIRKLNDQFRQTFLGGVVVTTPAVQCLQSPIKTLLLRRVREFNNFDPDNDPFGEHDFGAVEVKNDRYYWKIDYYDRSLKYGSDDPSDSITTTRVLTIMCAEEY